MKDFHNFYICDCEENLEKFITKIQRGIFDRWGIEWLIIIMFNAEECRNAMIFKFVLYKATMAQNGLSERCDELLNVRIYKPHPYASLFYSEGYAPPMFIYTPDHFIQAVFKLISAELEKVKK